MSEHRMPPKNVDAETCVLGAILVDNQVMEQVKHRLEPSHFYAESNRLIYAAMIAVYEKGGVIDMITLSDELLLRGHLDGVGGTHHIASLSKEVPSAAHSSYYESIVSRHGSLREFVSTAERLIQEVYDGVANYDEFMDRAVSTISGARVKAKGSTRTMNSIVRDVFRDIERAHQTKGESTIGVLTGLDSVDALMLGWKPTEMTILAARPGMGKTALACQMAMNAAINGTPVIFFSLEMADKELVLRMLLNRAQIDKGDLRSGRITDRGWGRLIKAAGELSALPMEIDETPGLSIGEMKHRARQFHLERGKIHDQEQEMKRKEWVGKGKNPDAFEKAEFEMLVFVDYLQITKNPAAPSREREVGTISLELKNLAKELRVSTIVLAQLNRKCDERSDKRPLNSDLRDSGQIEQDADNIVFIYRDEVYNKDSPNKGEAEVIIRKGRDIALGTARLKFVGAQSRFEDLGTAF